MRFERMKPGDFERAKAAAPIAYLPWGSHEWHGKHNPLGVDSLKAHAMCLNLCAETGGIVFPPVYCGHQTMKVYSGETCTLEFSAECVKLVAREYLEQLADEGFLVVVLLSGHHGGDHIAALRQVASEFNESQEKTLVWALRDDDATSEDGFFSDHGALYETSYMMFMQAEHVDLTRLPDDSELDMYREGLMGLDPRSTASAKIGRDGVNALVKNAGPKILEMLKAQRAKAGPKPGT